MYVKQWPVIPHLLLTGFNSVVARQSYRPWCHVFNFELCTSNDIIHPQQHYFPAEPCSGEEKRSMCCVHTNIRFSHLAGSFLRRVKHLHGGQDL
jgi:hypothetical protein